MPPPEKRDHWFVNYHAPNDSTGDPSEGLRHLHLRNTYFNKGDFLGKKVLDLGCNAGQMLMHASMLGANYALGIDYDAAAVREARKATADQNIDVLCDDLDNYLAYTGLTHFDTAMLLSVIGTEELTNPMGILARVSSLADVLYLEGHHTSIRSDLMKAMISYTGYQNIEYKGKTYDNKDDKVGRDFFRLSRRLLPRPGIAVRIIMEAWRPGVRRVGVMGFGGVGKSTLRKEVVRDLQDRFCSDLEKIYSDPNNPESLVYYSKSKDLYILDDAPKFYRPSTLSKYIIFDYVAQPKIQTLFYLTSDIKARMQTRKELDQGLLLDLPEDRVSEVELNGCSYHRSPTIDLSDLQSVYHIEPYELQNCGDTIEKNLFYN